MAKINQHGSHSVCQQEHTNHEFLLHAWLQADKHVENEQLQVRHVRSVVLHRMQTTLSLRTDL